MVPQVGCGSGGENLLILVEPYDSDPDTNDFLIQVNLATGKVVPGAFNGDDYAVIEALIHEGEPLDDVDDIAFDPADGFLYAVVNDSHYEDHLVLIGPSDGSLVANIGDFFCVIAQKKIQDLEGMGFGCDGTSDIAIFRGSRGLWDVRGVTWIYFGRFNDRPVSADYDGDGTSDIAIYRPGTGLWAIRRVSRVYFGAPADVPISGDYTGDVMKDIAIFRPASAFGALRSLTKIYYGKSGDVPVTR